MAGGPGGNANARLGQLVHHVLAGIPRHGDGQHVGRGPLCDKPQIGDFPQPLHGIGFHLRHVPQFILKILQP
ncbi:hypothetical protein SDC9_192684 [bioreactor metagenome]|uniref:Uncharacterized protein n=1 Tax=bioreactor metagenome TaxID=1076179 RepID=A0A645I1E7_9ZZZZ